MKVKDCMCNDVCCVKPETKINEVAKIMSQNHIGCVPVCDQNNCICQKMYALVMKVMI